MNDNRMFSDLAAPFPPEAVEFRIGSTSQDKKKGMALAYIDARDVMDRLDAVCGPSGWQNDYPHATGKTVCRIGIKVGDEWIWKSDGAGDTDVEAEKGALSDAFKRAAVRWGIGRYLYDVKNAWVEIEPRGRSFVIPDSELKRLRTMLARSQPAAPAAKITSAQDKEIWDWIERTNTNAARFLTAFNITATADLPADKYASAIAMLRKKAERSLTPEQIAAAEQSTLLAG